MFAFRSACARRIRQPGSIPNAGPCALLIRNTHVLQLFGGPVPVRELQHGGRRLSNGQIPGVQVSRVYVRAVQRHRRRLSGQMPRREWHWRDYYPLFTAVHVWFVFYTRGVAIATKRRPMTHDATFGHSSAPDRWLFARVPSLESFTDIAHAPVYVCSKKNKYALKIYAYCCLFLHEMFVNIL